MQQVMKNKDFLQELSDRLKWSPDEVAGMLSEFSFLLGTRLLDGDTVALEEFGQFEPRKKSERISVNPTNGKRYLVPPKLVPVFKPGVTTKTQLKELSNDE
jgi:DNA-binding protein HU-beta